VTINILQHTTTHCNTLQHTATQKTAAAAQLPARGIHQHIATYPNTLQHTATLCNTLQTTPQKKQLLLRNCLRVGTINIITTIFCFIGKFFIAIATALIGRT